MQDLNEHPIKGKMILMKVHDLYFPMERSKDTEIKSFGKLYNLSDHTTVVPLK